ncbi:MAG TPA: endonuclease III [Actinomycetota bacterium]
MPAATDPATIAPAAPAAPAPPGRGPKRRVTRTDPPERRFPVIWRRLVREYPDAKCALHFSNSHEMLFATMLSAQTTDAMVNKVTEKLFVKYPTLEDYASADRAELEQDVKPTGFYRMKAKHVQETAQRLLEDFGGKVPETLALLTTLPGVARKTANVVLGNAFGKVEGIAVDTHVRRLARRLGLTTHDEPDKIEQDLMRLVPKSKWFHLTYLLIEHGRKVCKAPTPRCEDCVLADLCPSSRV